MGGLVRRIVLAMLAGLPACYGPHAATGVACAPATGGARCPAGQVCVARGGAEVCEPEGTPGEVDAAVARDAPPAPDASSAWWDGGWAHRRPIDVVAGAHGLPAGYSIAVTFDHAALVAAGEAQVAGDDVRIVGAAGEVDRVLDSGSDWSRPDTTLWFRTAAALAPGEAVRFWLYYGNLVATSPPADPSAVFLLADGFEGSLAAWWRDNGVYASGNRAHHGNRSMMIPMQAQTVVGFGAQALDEQDVAFDLWWNLEDTTAIDAYQGIRGNDSSTYYTNLQPPDADHPSTWDISKTDAGSYQELVPPPAGATSPAANTWFRVTVYAYAQTMAVDVGGVRYVPTAGFAALDATTSGNVQAGVYQATGRSFFDDATVRRLVEPEPTVVLGAEQAP